MKKQDILGLEHASTRWVTWIKPKSGMPPPLASNPIGGYGEGPLGKCDWINLQSGI
jgi:hypothetical protein